MRERANESQAGRSAEGNHSAGRNSPAGRSPKEAEPYIRLENVSYTYPNGQTGIEEITLSLYSGHICALVGANGAGKSTLYKTVMGLLRPQRGNVSLLGMSVEKALKKNMVSYVPQSERVDWNFPVLVRDVVMMGRYGHMGLMRLSSKEDQEIVTEALARVDMDKCADRQIGELSGGQKKRVFVARALAQQSEIVLLDEPFAGVDVKTEAMIISLLRELRAAGKLIFVSTHNLGSVPDFCDEAVLLNRRLVAAGPITSCFTRENLTLAFGAMLRQVEMGASDIHDDEDERSMIVITDDERPLVYYGEEADRQLYQKGEENSPENKNPARKDKMEEIYKKGGIGDKDDIEGGKKP